MTEQGKGQEIKPMKCLGSEQDTVQAPLIRYAGEADFSLFDTLAQDCSTGLLSTNVRRL